MVLMTCCNTRFATVRESMDHVLCDATSITWIPIYLAIVGAMTHGEYIDFVDSMAEASGNLVR